MLWLQILILQVLIVYAVQAVCIRPLSAVLLCVQWWRCTATRPQNLTTCPSPRATSSTWRIAMTMAGGRVFSTGTEASSLKTTSNHVARLKPHPLSVAPQVLFYSCCHGDSQCYCQINLPAVLPPDIKHSNYKYNISFL